ncbi:helix-turn-helix transcriptional regulator [Domibacillus enclensis]|uniref:AraC family transcriptional regulator n=1 Tax=Domibacillus enclensis TaxID=1017273 RepID=A0A1N7CXM8_9BACI|nr:AraC family transcriptional regulator [Domibacillus enclensis]OXS73137.1 AraC family transcriptional regulator [Domibacillus enclensis]SIR68372.1 AraC-type DNA-binding protein [Domibacillus enclensis]
MLKEYLHASLEQPVLFTLGGKFVTDIHWTHMKRSMGDYEMIIGIHGTLYIQCEATAFEVKPGDVLILPPHKVHQGYKECQPGTSFYWFHFLFPDNSAPVIINELEVDRHVKVIQSKPELYQKQSAVFLPFFSAPHQSDRLTILFNQLLDVASAHYYHSRAVDFLATSILIELSEQMIKHFHLASDQKNSDKKIASILEWIRLNSLEEMSTGKVAVHFNYNRDYLCRFFKKETGLTVQEYIHMLKLSKAKDLLTLSNESIGNISRTIGFQDERYFMRLFKQYEKLTPSEYRKAYHRIPLNKE